MKKYNSLFLFIICAIFSLKSMEKLENRCQNIDFCTSDSLVYIDARSNSINLYDIKTKTITSQIKMERGSSLETSYFKCLDENIVAYGGINGIVELFDLKKNKSIFAKKLSASSIQNVHFLDGKMIAIDRETNCIVEDLKTNK